MHCHVRPTRLIASLLILGLSACGTATNNPDDAGSAFCDSMEQVASRMEPDPNAPPAAVRATFADVVGLLHDAEQHAPAAIADDVADFASVIDAYVVALAEVDYDLAAIFSTPEGAQLAMDTSHALTPAVIDHMTGLCGITLS